MKPYFTILALVVCCVLRGMAGTTGKIAGEVKDSQTGEPIIGANITVEGTSTGAATNVEGYFVILNIPPGKYNIAASAVGYTKKVLTGVVVSVDLTSKADFTLVESAVQGEEIVVVAERPVIKKDLTSSEARVDGSTIEQIPVNEVSEVLTLQAGVTTDKGGGIHIRGGRTSEVAYWVDGVSISDAFDRSQAVQVDNSAIQELQVISGTFNAEYGQAMSGIVNIVTRDGGQLFHGSISAYTGSYVTSDGGSNSTSEFSFNPVTESPTWLTDKTYFNLDKVRPLTTKNLEGSLSGPVPGTPFTFYVSGRYFKTDGWLYGNHVFNNDGTLDENTVRLRWANGVGNLPLAVSIHDNPRPMNGRERFSGQAKLSWQITGDMKFTLSALGAKIDFKDFNNDYRLMPDADVNKYDRNYNITGQFTHTLSSSSFYTVSLSFLRKYFMEHLYEDPFDSRYIVDPTPVEKALDQYNVYGTNNHRFYRNTETRSGKIDYTDQVSKLHLLKVGAEAKLHRLYFEDYTLFYQQVGNRYVPAMPLNPITNTGYDEYTMQPVEFAAYAQDKLEYESMIVNIGLRFDYFNSKGSVLSDDPISVQTADGIATVIPTHDPNVYSPQTAGGKALTLQERLARWYRKASAKTSVSPRFGISYPITDKGILHFSYGHFLQIPSFDKLYQRPAYKVPISTGIVSNVYGNSDLNAERTVQYELGLQQELSNSLSIDVTGFYKDTRDWVSSSPTIYVGENADGSVYSYSTYINQDYANARGITISINKRPTNLFSLNFSYTYQTIEGVNSGTDEALAASRNNDAPTQSLAPLDWDQTHTANLTLGYGKEEWGAFLIGRYGSGLPYTPAISQAESRGVDAARSITKNSRRRPANYTVDLRLFKTFTIEPLSFAISLKVLNLFDTRNEIDVYGQTGRATATPEQMGVAGSETGGRVNTVASYLMRPDFYSEPREIQLGLEINY
jgi:outer membrane receptor protein involved in Fe transport